MRRKIGKGWTTIRGGGQDGCKRGAGVGHWDDKDPDKHILLNNAIAAGTPLDKYNVKRSFPTNNSHRISLIKMRPYYIIRTALLKSYL